MKYALVLAILFAGAQGYKLSGTFATGMNGDEDLGEDITMKGDKFHYNQRREFQIALAQAASRKQSGVRARWVELPDCVGATGTDNSVPLRDDLSNAVVATCKGKKA